MKKPGDLFPDANLLPKVGGVKEKHTVTKKYSPWVGHNNDSL